MMYDTLFSGPILQFPEAKVRLILHGASVGDDVLVKWWCEELWLRGKIWSLR